MKLSAMKNVNIRRVRFADNNPVFKELDTSSWQAEKEVE